jgi:hypothetical protein
MMSVIRGVSLVLQIRAERINCNKFVRLYVILYLTLIYLLFTYVIFLSKGGGANLNRRASDGGANIHRFCRQMMPGNSQAGSMETLTVKINIFHLYTALVAGLEQLWMKVYFLELTVSSAVSVL